MATVSVTPSANTVFTFDPPLAVSAGQSAAFTLALERAQVSAAGDSALPPIAAEGSKADGGGMAAVAVTAPLLLLSGGMAARRRWVVGGLLGTAALVTLVAVGCGGGGGAGTGSPLFGSGTVAPTSSTVVVASVEGKTPSGGTITYPNLPLALPPMQVER